MTTTLINTTDSSGGRRLHTIQRNTHSATLLAVVTWLDRADLSLGASAADALPEPSPNGLSAAPTTHEKFRSVTDLEGIDAVYQIQLGPHGHHEIFVLQRDAEPDKWAVTFSAFFPDHGAKSQVS